MNERGPVWLLGGYLALHLFNRFLTAHVCDRPAGKSYVIGLTGMLGIGLHSFIDGIVYSIAFAVSVFTGVVSAIGMALHEFPEGIITYVLLLRGGLSDRKAFWWTFFAAACTTPLGTLTSYPVIASISRPFLGALLALSAGMLIYVGATHLLPRAERAANRYSLVAFGAGILTAVGIVWAKS